MFHVKRLACNRQSSVLLFHVKHSAHLRIAQPLAWATSNYRPRNSETTFRVALAFDNLPLAFAALWATSGMGKGRYPCGWSGFFMLALSGSNKYYVLAVKLLMILDEDGVRGTWLRASVGTGHRWTHD